jgi:hypothetical protein
LVVANLGTAPLSDVTIASADRVLASGRYAAVSLLGGPPAASFRVGGNGRIDRYVPFRSLGAMEIHVLQFTR